MNVRMPVSPDIETLRALLNYTGEFLRWAVIDSGCVRDLTLRKEFADGLQEVEARLLAAARELDDIESEEDPRFQRLAGVGLTGQQLSIKTRVLKFVTRIGQGIVRPLGWINAFLGSAAKAFPKLELVKEYKEHLELVVEQQHDGGTAPPLPSIP